MFEDIRKFARLGLVHHMLYPQSIEDPGYHVETLLQLIERGVIETFDCCLPFGDKQREQLIPAIKRCGKEVVMSAHLSLMQKIAPGIPEIPPAPDYLVQDEIHSPSLEGNLLGDPAPVKDLDAGQ